MTDTSPKADVARRRIYGQSDEEQARHLMLQYVVRRAVHNLIAPLLPPLKSVR